MTYVALDVGGTKLAAARVEKAGSGAWEITTSRTDPTASVRDPAVAVRAVAGPGKLEGVGIGVAGPVTGRRVTLTNLPWTLDADALSADLGCPVFLMNDLEALGHGVLALPKASFSTWAPGETRAGGKALVAAGTGLGVALMPFDGGKHIVVPTEGGHTDFAPSDAAEDELLVYLRARYSAGGGDGHVSWERVVSGLDGFANLVTFLENTGRVKVPAGAAGELAASPSVAGSVVGAAAARAEPWAKTVVAWFARLYGAACGNVVLSSLALGGLYLGGGVTTKLLPHLDKSEFLAAFRAKGRFANLLDQVPVYVVTEQGAALIGAAARASTLSVSRD